MRSKVLETSSSLQQTSKFSYDIILIIGGRRSDKVAGERRKYFLRLPDVKVEKNIPPSLSPTEHPFGAHPEHLTLLYNPWNTYCCLLCLRQSSNFSALNHTQESCQISTRCSCSMQNQSCSFYRDIIQSIQSRNRSYTIMLKVNNFANMN